MNRMELLKLALETTKDAREALSVAREMEAFVNGATVPEPPLTPVMVRPKPAPRPVSRAKAQWTQEEKERAAALLDNGASYTEVARVLRRSPRAVKNMRCDNKLPVKAHRLDKMKQLQGAVAAVSRGFTLRPETANGVFAKEPKQ